MSEETAVDRFTLDPDYENFIPGKTPLKRSTFVKGEAIQNGFMALVSLFFIIVPLFIMLIQPFFQDEMFRWFGQTTTGRVTGCVMRQTRSKSYFADVVYIYAVTDKTYRDAGAQPGDCSSYPAGSTLTVRYLSIDPHQSRTHPAEMLMEQRQWFDMLCLLPLPVICLVALVIALEIIRRSSYGERIYPRLQRKGVVLAGEIIKIEATAESNYIIKVHYGFVAPQKRQLTGKIEAIRNDLRGQELPPIGTPIGMLYAGDNAHIML